MSRVAVLAAVLLAVVAACGGDDGASTAAVAPAPLPSAAAAPEPAPSRHPPPAILPSDLHLDEYGSEYTPRAPRDFRRDEDEIELLLRSTPPGAVASVDGQRLGVTPVVWRGRAGTRSLEFTFVLPGYSMARYRFVPMTSGIVHGTLRRVPAVPPKAGDAGPPAAPSTD